MAKVHLEFDIPQEREEFESAWQGADYRGVIDNLFEWLRQLSKYENRESVAIDEVREKISELMKERGL